MIQFKTIRWKNLLSTGNAFTEINFTDTRTALILGQNGSGKSTLLDALCFVLFNRPFRDVNKPQLVNSVNGKKCVVEVEFSVGQKAYKIVRGIKPTVFEIYVNDELINQDASARDYQKYLEESVLKLNFKSFTQIVILGSASFTQFMKLTAGARREIIEDILDIQIFTLMNGLLKSRVKETAETHIQLGRDLDLAKQKVGVQESYLKTLQEDRQLLIQEQKRIIKLTNAAVNANVIQIGVGTEEQNRIVDSIDELRGRRALLLQKETALREVQRDAKRLLAEIADAESTKICPTCLRPLEVGDNEDHLEAKRDEVTALARTEKALHSTVAKFRSRVTELEHVEQDARVLDDNIRTLKNDNKHYLNQIQVATSIIENLSAKTGNVADEQKKLRALAKDVMAVAGKRTAIGEDKFYLEIVGTMLKDSGIKTRIIDQYLPIINKLVNKYLAEMDFFVQFTLDNEFKEVIRSRHRDEFSYASFSEGEKQRIDLALLFTWRTIAKLKNSASTNLLILDEVFDSSLDSTATEYVMGLLKTLSADSHVFVISHKPDALVDKFQRILTFEKKQNFSVLEVS